MKKSNVMDRNSQIHFYDWLNQASVAPKFYSRLPEFEDDADFLSGKTPQEMEYSWEDE